ncbi:cold-shock protein [Thioclava sp. SK-1]|uniref:cold-shock protein n=1 Tax=Thioclava sp. SK-1 TaxID=1889770 RepID=UPI0008257A98|nr:cold shock domain-containing protein [Thioclava sp. SK-1]OCX64699.1 cold-shock protein [Thioclava sp. SK-1]
MDDSVAGQRKLTGKVKWFDPGKGFGFILDAEGGPDILLHANVLRNFGQGSVADNAQITVHIQATPRGVQAVEVLEIEPPEGDENVPPIEDLGRAEVEDLHTLPLEPSRVKWFDKAKGFGFANVFGRPEDVFIHIEVLRRSGFADLGPGEAICLRVIDGRRGRMAAQVVSWDVALRSSEEG